MWRDDATLLDIAQVARRIVSFLRGVDEALFAPNKEKHWAVVAQLLIIGETVTRLSAEFRSSYPEIEWAKISKMRSQLIHGYDKIQWDLVWGTTTENVPQLPEQIKPLLPAEEP